MYPGTTRRKYQSMAVIEARRIGAGHGLGMFFRQPGEGKSLAVLDGRELRVGDWGSLPSLKVDTSRLSGDAGHKVHRDFVMSAMDDLLV